MRMIMNSMRIANRMSKIYPDRRRHHAVKPSTRNEEVDMWTRGIRDAVTAEETEQPQVIPYVQGGDYHSNITDEKLDKDKVEDALMEEMRYFARMGVHKKVSYTQAVERTGRTCIRSRPGAKEFNDGIDETMHAAMPPLEALKMLTAKCSAREQQRRDKMVNPKEDSCSA